MTGTETERSGDRVGDLPVILARVKNKGQPIRLIVRQDPSDKDEVITALVDVLGRTLKARTAALQKWYVANACVALNTSELVLSGPRELR
ncbi:hypothetical protein FJN17_34235 [Bradyrhizobium symbiodeficiens]|uniref:Uncharacterized protein n=1 Tax=Bradyrhizobium symbiodeficiens TaxID=1404367 RepID=A0ABZ2F215_9BRAD|nr:hypothetical protein [Bradyrhizobium symbiodeficiens]